MGLIVPEVGWLAAALMPAGAIIGLSMLGVAVALCDGNASDEEINDWYDRVACDSDPVYLLNQFYVSLEALYSFLEGHLGALTRWTEEPDLQNSQMASDLADLLRTVKWSETEPRAGGDLLGRVKNQMDSIGHRRTKVFDYVPIEAAMVDMVVRGHGWHDQQRSFIDAWCGSGIRVIAMARLQTMFGFDNAQTSWRLNDPSSVAIAMAGLNMVGYQIGPDVKLTCNREWAEMWAASTFEGNSASYLEQLPPELSIDAPALRRKRLGR